MLCDATLESLAFLTLLKLDKGLLLIDGLALLLYGFLKCGFCISFTFSAFLLAFGFTFDLGCWVLRFFGFLLSGTLGGGRTLLLLLKLSESLRIGLNLSLDSINVLLGLSVLHPDLGEYLTDLPQRVDFADVFTFTAQESRSQLLDFSLLRLVVSGIVNTATV